MRRLADVAGLPPPGPPHRSVMLLFLCALAFAWWCPPSAQAQPVPTAQQLSATAVVWAPPIPNASPGDVLRPFVPPQMPWSAAHRGIDIQASQATVTAPAAAEVTFVGVVVDRPVITIRHPNGLLSSFEPVESALNVGDRVTQGQVIGQVVTEVTHCTVQCVHWGVRKPDAWHIGASVRDLYLDPAFLLGWTEPSILWPVHSEPPG